MNTPQSTDLRVCHYCRTGEREMRPYGPDGAWVCFPCAFATPERKAETEQNYGAQLMGSGPAAVIGEETGPRPLAGKTS